MSAATTAIGEKDVESKLDWISMEQLSKDIAGEYTPLEAKGNKMIRKIKENPFIPIGLLLTTGILTKGILSMLRGDKVMSQRMMRWRIAAQGSTVVALMLGIVFQSRNGSSPSSTAGSSSDKN